MSAVELLQPILDTRLQRNNFFNGRLLSAEDLRAEQDANRVQRGQFGCAMGDGVAWGLGISVLSVGPDQPRIAVGRGLAVNRAGDLLSLSDDAEVTLVPESQAQETAAGLFAACEPPRGSAALTGAGAYVLVVAPASGYRGTALVSDPNATTIGRGACGARFSVEGVRFRLVPLALGELGGIDPALRDGISELLPPANVPARERLRNRLAHLCFGTHPLRGYFADPLKQVSGVPARAGWGALAAMRDRKDLTDCDVPLALVVLTPEGISFVDMWPARRKLLDAAAIDVWQGVAGPRRVAEGEAAFLQFQSQLEVVKGAASPPGIAAASYFDVLPPGGWLPTGVPGFDWKTFLGPHAPPAVTPVDAALLRGILERSWCDEPFELATDPPVPVRVYEVPDQVAGESFVVFARSAKGNIRVVLSPPVAITETVEVTATAETGALTRATTRSDTYVTVPELVPGLHHVAVTAPDYVLVPPQDKAVVGGRTVDVQVTLTLLPNGSILVDAIDKVSGTSIGAAVNRITASDGALTRSGSFQPSTGKWLIDDLPAATYTLTGSASRYKTATKRSVGPTARGHTIDTQLIFEPQPARKEPSRCVGVPEAKKPPLRRVRLCLVLSATEFEESYFFRDQQAFYTQARVTNDKLRMVTRGEAVMIRPSDRYASYTGEILYTRPLWDAMIPLEPELPQVQEWLLQWRDWFAETLDDPAIGKSNPVVYIDPKYRPTVTARDVRATPPAYAVFRRFGVPIAIMPEDGITRAPVEIQKGYLRGIPEERVRKLIDAQILYFNDLAWGWGELITDATGDPPDIGRYLIADAATAVGKINEERSYLAGIDTDTDGAMRALGINDDVALANADADKLGDKLGSKGFALRLIEQARQIVPKDSWSLDNLGLSGEQVRALGEGGIDSMGAFVASAGRADGKALIAEVTGLDAESAATRDTVLGTVTNQAVLIMTRSSLEAAPQPMLATWKSVDSITAGKLGDAGIASVEELAAAKPEDVAAATNLPAAAAGRLVSDAKAASRSNLAVGTLAPVTRAEEKDLTNLFKTTFGVDATIGTVGSKTAAEIAGAFGGNVGRASAVLAGIKAGMGVGGLR